MTEFHFQWSGSISQVLAGVGGWARARIGANWKWAHGRDRRSGFRNSQGSEGCALLCGEPFLGNYKKTILEQNRVKKMRTS